VIYNARPIHDALEAGELSIVKLLVQNGADFMAEYGGKTPLELAKSHGHLDIANYLEGSKLVVLILRDKSTGRASKRTCKEIIGEKVGDNSIETKVSESAKLMQETCC
jgi:hypothetical protein